MMRNLAKYAAITSVLLIGSMLPSAAQQGQQPPAGKQPAADVANAAPFVLTPQEQIALDQFLVAWERQSASTERLEAKFKRWHYDLLAAPLGVHSTWAEGVIKYGAPDKGLFRVDQLKFFTGMVDGKPTYAETPGQFGEHWVSNGEALLEFDRSMKECRIQQLPPELRGKEIFESPLPFVFNLNAAKIKQRYWIHQIVGPPGVVVIEAFPKSQADRAQYKFVRIALSAKTFLPEALIMYGPNFHEQTAPAYDHYEFTDVQRNSLRSGVAAFMKSFIDERPPADWRVVEDSYRPEPPTQGQTQVTEAPAGNTIRQR